MRKSGFISRVCVVVAAVFVLCGISFAAEQKVGFINLQRLVNESKMGEAAKKDVEKLRMQRETTVNNKLAEVNKLKELLEKSGKGMSAKERKDVSESFQRFYKEYQRLLADAREEITREDRALVAGILEKADGVLKAVAKKQKYTMILKDPNSIGYLDPSVDITDEVVKELNK
jgi:outer membrane protein